MRAPPGPIDQEHRQPTRPALPLVQPHLFHLQRRVTLFLAEQGSDDGDLRRNIFQCDAQGVPQHT